MSYGNSVHESRRSHAEQVSECIQPVAQAKAYSVS